MQAKSAERAFGYRPSDSHPCPAGTKSNRCYGRSSDSSRSPRLPGKNQWQRVRMNRFSRKRGTYSSEHCSGFSPDSLLIPADDSARKTNNGTKILFFSVHYLHFRKNSDHHVRKQYFMSFRNVDKIRNHLDEDAGKNRLEARQTLSPPRRVLLQTGHREGAYDISAARHLGHRLPLRQNVRRHGHPNGPAIRATVPGMGACPDGRHGASHVE